MPQCAWEGQRTTWGSQFSLSTVSLRIELRMSLLAVSSFYPLNYLTDPPFFLRRVCVCVCVCVLHVGVDECLHISRCMLTCVCRRP